MVHLRLKKNRYSLFNNPVFFTSRFRGPLELQRYLSLIILKISAFFPCLIRINRKLNTVTPQLSILKRDKNVFLGELVHKPTNVSEIWHFPTKQSQYKEWNCGIYNSNTDGSAIPTVSDRWVLISSDFQPWPSDHRQFHHILLF